MNSSWLCANLAAYGLQIGLLVGLAAFVPAIVRLRAPRARLLYWQFLLAACLLLPLVRPWRQQTIAGDVEVSTTMVRVLPSAPHRRPIPWNDGILALLAAGALARLAWLGVGFYRLRRYRLHAAPFGGTVGCSTLISADIASPVTFGLLRPVILLPAHFPEMPGTMRQAILCHESCHVKRRDWAFTVVEEMLRALFWFHPAIWWLLSEIQLAREQTVDQCVVAATGARDAYVDTLLAVAGKAAQLDLAPAPLFLRRRHLKQRLVGILKERTMSKRALISALTAGLVLLGEACWFVTGALPLAAAPQVVADAPGVSVNLNGAALMHRVPVAYPADAIAHGVEGAVVVQVTLDANGEVSDASISSGPEELRKPVMQSVLNWHFTKDLARTTRSVSVDFALPQKTPAAASSASPGPMVRGFALTTGTPFAATIGTPEAANRTPAAAPPFPGTNSARLTVSGIHIEGLSETLTEQLLATLPVRQGDSVDAAQLSATYAAVKAFDSHLTFRASRSLNGEIALAIALPNTAAPSAVVPPLAPGAVPQRIRVGGNVQAVNLLVQQRPIYPPAAKQAHIQGVVELAAIIARDGRVEDLKVLQGHPLLMQAALDAVKNWVYKPTLLNGDPVEVSTIIDVNFTLTQ